MFALIRVRFSNTPPENVWSDEVMNNWMNPTIPFSLAHYWTRTSLFQADMRYYLFPPITMDDPRGKTPPGASVRDFLVDGVRAAVTELFHPDWNVFDRLLIVFAQGTDQFGQLLVDNGLKSMPAAVCDIASPFSNIMQEVGHTFGLNHELDYNNKEYTSPYSCMSSELYGNAVSSFERPEDTRLPRGTSPAPNVSEVVTDDVQRIIGPYITPVQFYVKAMGMFIDDKTVYRVPDSYKTEPHSFRLTAVDVAIDSFPVRKVMLAVLPPLVDNGDVYFLELRRHTSYIPGQSNVNYDAGLSNDGSNRPPTAVVVHAFNPTTKRVHYENRVALAASAGDRDYHSFHGFFAVRLNSFAEDFSSCSVTVGGGDFWKYLGVGFDNIITDSVPQDDSDWMTAGVSPCFMFPESSYQYRYLFNRTEITLKTSSFGYELPNYRWFLNDEFLDPANPDLKLKIAVRSPVDGFLSEPVEEEIIVNYIVTKNTLKLIFSQSFAGVSAAVKVVVNESSNEVIQNTYPERSIWTGIVFNNVSIEWDQAYNDARKACEKKIKEVNDHYSISKSLILHGSPRPDFGVYTVDLINQLAESNPIVANVVINEVARLGNISRLEVIKKLN